MEERFWLSILKAGEDECWNWQLSTDRKGYGRLWTGERNERGHAIRMMAHRFAYELLVGEVPVGLLVLHHCDNPSCCNPKHLWVGTQSENVMDSVAKGRFTVNRRKLNDEQVNLIRLRYALGEVTQRGLAREYGVGKATIWAALQ